MKQYLKVVKFLIKIKFLSSVKNIWRSGVTGLTTWQPSVGAKWPLPFRKGHVSFNSPLPTQLSFIPTNLLSSLILIAWTLHAFEFVTPEVSFLHSAECFPSSPYLQWFIFFFCPQVLTMRSNIALEHWCDKGHAFLDNGGENHKNKSDKFVLISSFHSQPWCLLLHSKQ